MQTSKNVHQFIHTIFRYRSSHRPITKDSICSIDWSKPAPPTVSIRPITFEIKSPISKQQQPSNTKPLNFDSPSYERERRCLRLCLCLCVALLITSERCLIRWMRLCVCAVRRQRSGSVVFSSAEQNWSNKSHTRRHWLFARRSSDDGCSLDFVLGRNVRIAACEARLKWNRNLWHKKRMRTISSMCARSNSVHYTRTVF